MILIIIVGILKETNGCSYVSILWCCFESIWPKKIASLNLNWSHETQMNRWIEAGLGQSDWIKDYFFP